jgi:hypothetical protein
MFGGLKMAFERENISVAKKIVLNKSELAVECNISADAEVKKVLSVSVCAYVQSIETIAGIVNYSGSVDTKLVIMLADGQINTVCSSCPFSSKFENDEIEAGQNAFVKVAVVDYNIESIGGEMVKLVVNLSQSGFVLTNVSVPTIDCHDDDICLKKEEISVIKYVGSATGTATIESEIFVRENIKKVMLSQSQVCVKSVTSGAGFVSLSGDVITRVLYLSENDKFECGYINDTFKEELELANATRDSFVEGDAFVKQDLVQTEVVSEEKGNKIIVKVPIMLCARAFVEEKESVIKDVYSVSNEIGLTTESFAMTTISPMAEIEGKIEGSMVLDSEFPRVDKLLFSGGGIVSITNSYIRDGEVFIEGVARVTSVYLNDEDSSINSVQLDVPFVLSDKFDVEEGGVISVDAVVVDEDVVVKKGREFYYDGRVKVSICYSHEIVSSVIASANVIEPFAEKDYAMEVVFASKGSNLWDIAKSVRVKEEQVLLQNPDVAFPIQNDVPIILFYQRLK